MIGGIILAAAMALEAPLADPAAERRAQNMFMEIKCVVCEGEPIAQSQAEVAADMRIRIRTEISAGKTDQEIRNDLASHYGESVLLRPSVNGLGALLWLFPLAAFLGGGVLLAGLLRHRARSAGIEPEAD